MKGCGCKICENDFGDSVNDLASDGDSLKSILQFLEKQGLKVSKKVLKKHLDAFEIPYKDDSTVAVVEDCEPVKIELNKVDFSQYNFDENKPDTIIGYLQKLNLKLYLNQLQIVLQRQDDVIKGKSPEVNSNEVKNLSLIFQILEKSTAMAIQINQREAIRIVESMGLSVEPLQQLPPLPTQNNVQGNSEPKTD